MGERMSMTDAGCGVQLASLCGTSLAPRFRTWTGQSRRRYVTSTFAVDRADVGGGLPEFDRCIVLAARDGAAWEGRGALIRIDAVGKGSERRRVVALGLAAGATHWHVHFPDAADAGWRSRAGDLLASYMPIAALSA